MRRVKKTWEDSQSIRSILDEIIMLLSDKHLDKLIDYNITLELLNIKEKIDTLNHLSKEEFISISDAVRIDLLEIYHVLVNLLKTRKEEKFSNNQVDELIEAIKKIRSSIRELKYNLEIYSSRNNAIYNSEKFYNEQIQDLNKQKLELLEFLERQKHLEGKSKEEISQHKKRIKEKELELLKANELLKAYQKDLEEKKKKENIIVEWNSKIKSTFDELTRYLSPIKKEHGRLNKMFWIFSFLTVSLVISIIFLEVFVFNRLNKSLGFPEWENYLATIVPIPVFAGLLWAFIIQLNRTQRQLVILAKHIHEVEYVEGLLLAINSLSPDINNSTKRVNEAIDRLLENHLNASSKTGSISEDKILTEENKDTIPIDLVIKLLKETKQITKK